MRATVLFYQNVAQAIEAAHPSKLDDLSRAIWSGMGAGAITDDQAQELAERIHARRSIAAAEKPAQAYHRPASIFGPRRYQKAPKRPAAIERRRKLAASAPLPPALAARFTTGELAVLRIVGDEARDRGACRLDVQQIHMRAGVCRSLAQAALRKAEREGLLKIEERRRPGRKNLPNVVTIISREWTAWHKRGPKRPMALEIGSKKVDPYRIRISHRSEAADRASVPLGGRRDGSEPCRGDIARGMYSFGAAGEAIAKRE